jgi:uncharacterized membrane protein
MIYSFIGWIYESTVCSISQKKLINRGFLNGPVCPIYGFGALACILLLYQRTDNVFILFFAGMLLTSTIEYITAVLLEKLFNAKWWDYSHYRFNIKGRVSLLGAVVFGVLSVILIKFIHPYVSYILDSSSDQMLIALTIGLFITLMFDLYATVCNLLKLNSRLKEFQLAFNRFKEQYTKRTGELKNTLLDRFEESEYYGERLKKLLGVSQYQSKRLIRAFPGLILLKYNDAWQKLKSILQSNISNRKTRK